MTNQFSSSRYPHADGGHAMNGVCLFFVHFSFCSFLSSHHFSYISSFIFFLSFCFKSRSKIEISNQSFISDP